MVQVGVQGSKRFFKVWKGYIWVQGGMWGVEHSGETQMGVKV